MTGRNKQTRFYLDLQLRMIQQFSHSVPLQIFPYLNHFIMETHPVATHRLISKVSVWLLSFRVVGFIQDLCYRNATISDVWLSLSGLRIMALSLVQSYGFVVTEYLGNHFSSAHQRNTKHVGTPISVPSRSGFIMLTK